MLSLTNYCQEVFSSVRPRLKFPGWSYSMPTMIFQPALLNGTFCKPQTRLPIEIARLVTGAAELRKERED